MQRESFFFLPVESHSRYQPRLNSSSCLHQIFSPLARIADHIHSLPLQAFFSKTSFSLAHIAISHQDSSSE